MYTSFFKLRSLKGALHIEFYTETVEQSDYKMERSGLERSDHGTRCKPLMQTSFCFQIPVTPAKVLKSSLTLLSVDLFKVKT